MLLSSLNISVARKKTERALYPIRAGFSAIGCPSPILFCICTGIVPQKNHSPSFTGTCLLPCNWHESCRKQANYSVLAIHSRKSYK
jgi:hypothetical protein